MRTITVTGSAVVSAPPDTVELEVGVRVRARTAASAMADAAGRQRAVIDALHAAGAGESEVQTRSLSCQPTYDDRGQRVTGYEVSSTVHVRSGDVGAAGALVDAAMTAAGDAAVVHGLSMSVRDDRALADQARADAFAEAHRKAEHLAELAGAVLGEVVSVDESGAGATPGPVFRMVAKAMPVAAGECTVQQNLTVVFAIGD